MKRIVPCAPKIGIVYGTYGSVPWIDLQLAALKKWEPHVKALVHDDSSPDAEKLRDLALSYGAQFVSTNVRKGWYPGDMSAFAEGLRWGEREGLDIVVKCSRRFVLVTPWRDGLAELMANTQFATASGGCSWFGFGFRSECCAMHVRSWIDSGACADMEGNVREAYNPVPGNPLEMYYHQLARKTHEFVHPVEEVVSKINNVHDPECDFNVRMEVRDFWLRRGQPAGAYAYWPRLGTYRLQRDCGSMFYNAYPDLNEYAALAKSLGLNYEVSDFLVGEGA